MAGRRRREEHLDNITVQQRKRNSKKSQQMSENKLHLEKLKMERWVGRRGTKWNLRI
jgi:hypothetical protein